MKGIITDKDYRKIGIWVILEDIRTLARHYEHFEKNLTEQDKVLIVEKMSEFLYGEEQK